MLSTHNLAEVEASCARAIIVSRGRIVADGPKQDMLTSERLSALFGTDIQIERRDGYYSLF